MFDAARQLNSSLGIPEGFGKPKQSELHNPACSSNTSNYDTELSLTGERGITKSATKNPQVRRLIWKSTRSVDKKARPFLWEWI